MKLSWCLVVFLSVWLNETYAAKIVCEQGAIECRRCDRGSEKASCEMSKDVVTCTGPNPLCVEIVYQNLTDASIERERTCVTDIEDTKQCPLAPMEGSFCDATSDPEWKICRSCEFKPPQDKCVEELTTPEPAPTTPKSEPTTPESAPTTPKSEPTTPESVPTTPKSEPTTPKSAPTTPKSEPTTPESVPTTPKSEPTTPESAPTTPKSEPTTPESVPTTPKSEPTTPESAPTTPKSEPTTPESVPTTPKSEPTTPESVPTTPESEPTTPESAPTTVSPPGPVTDVKTPSPPNTAAPTTPSPTIPDVTTAPGEEDICAEDEQEAINNNNKDEEGAQVSIIGETNDNVENIWKGASEPFPLLTRGASAMISFSSAKDVVSVSFITVTFGFVNLTLVAFNEDNTVFREEELRIGNGLAMEEMTHIFDVNTADITSIKIFVTDEADEIVIKELQIIICEEEPITPEPLKTTLVITTVSTEIPTTPSPTIPDITTTEVSLNPHGTADDPIRFCSLWLYNNTLSSTH